MIKLIACDLDGTLLDEQKRLPEQIFPLIERLYEKGVLFAPASGRQYDNLKNLFAPVADKILFIAENGALVKWQERTVFSLPLKKETILPALAVLKDEPWARVVVCGEELAFVETEEEPFFSLTKAAYTKLKKVDSLLQLSPFPPVSKIAVFDGEGKADCRAEMLKDKLLPLRTVVSGSLWFDISSPKVNKGVAIEEIQKSFGFSKEECLAFGDHMNDYEMLLACAHAFVTENCYPPLKELIPRTVPSNEEGGVIQFLENFLKTI